MYLAYNYGLRFFHHHGVYLHWWSWGYLHNLVLLSKRNLKKSLSGSHTWFFFSVFQLTNNLYYAWCAVLPINTDSIARVSGAILFISFIKHQRPITLNFIPAIIAEYSSIFCPHDSWSWHTAGWTRDGNIRFGKGCQFITNAQYYGTSVLSFDDFLLLRYINLWFGRLC